MFCAEGIVLLDVGMPIYFCVGQFCAVDSDPFVRTYHHLSEIL